MLTKMLDILN